MHLHLANTSRIPGGFTPWSIKPRDLLQHVFIIGTGPDPDATLLRLAEQRIRASEALAIIDSGGDLAKRSLLAVPRARTDDLIYFNPAGDRERPISINLLDGAVPASHDQVASDVVEALRSVYVTSWGPRTDWVLYNCLRTLLFYPGGSLVEVSKLLTNEPFRARVLEHVADPDTCAFWDNEFAGYTKGQRGDMVSPILNKVGRLHANPILGYTPHSGVL